MTKRKKQSNVLKNVIVSILLLIAMFFIFVGGYIYSTYEDDIHKMFQDETPITNESGLGCSGLDLFKTTVCLTNKVEGFYKYTITADDVDLTLEELKVHGGDCYDYSKLYAASASRLGFEYKFIYAPMTKSTTHVYIMMYDSSGYCVIDGIASMCMKYIE